MPIGDDSNKKPRVATDFELEIYAEMHNIINITDEFRASKANTIIITKLNALIKKIDSDTSDRFTMRLKNATSPNTVFIPTNILGRKGWEIKDSRGGLVIPATPDTMDSASKLFLQLQYRKINTELSIIITDMIYYLMTQGIFNYDATRDGNLYKTLLTGRSTEEEGDEFA